MHEARLCLSLLRLAEATLEREGGERIVAVDLDVGAWSGVAPEALESAFPVCARGSRAEGAALRAAAETGLREIALSGGCLQNRLLGGALEARLRDAGLRVLRHRRLPPNDGGLAVGQAVVAALRD
jgi:hydrogenase maturation protein HypF